LSAWQAVRATTAERVAQFERDRATTEAQIAESVNDFLTTDILGQAGVAELHIVDPRLAGNVSLRTALDIAAEKVGERFKGRPRVEAAIRLSIGDAYRQLGFDDLAKPHLVRAVELGGERAETDYQTNIAKGRLGTVLIKDDPIAAERYLVSARDGSLRSKDRSGPATLVAIEGLGRFYVVQGKISLGTTLLSQAVLGFRSTRGPTDHDTLHATADLAEAYALQNNLGAARSLLQESLRMIDEHGGAEHPDALLAKYQIAVLFAKLNEPSESIRLLEKLVPIERRVLGEGHHTTLLTEAMLSQHLMFESRIDIAEQMMVKALPLCRQTFGRMHIVTSLVASNLAAICSMKNDIEKARTHLLEAYEITRALYGPLDALTDDGNRLVSSVYLLTGERAAERYLREHLRYTLTHTPESSERYLTEGEIGFCMLCRKSRAEGELKLKLAQDWLARRASGVSPEVRSRVRALYTRVSGFYDHAGNSEQAAIWELRRADLDFPIDAFTH
jgi:non-specific serine/threonine protein kinase